MGQMSTPITGEEICWSCDKKVGTEHPNGMPIAANMTSVGFDDDGSEVRKTHAVVWHRECCPEIVLKMLEAQQAKEAESE